MRKKWKLLTREHIAECCKCCKGEEECESRNINQNSLIQSIRSCTKKKGEKLGWEKAGAYRGEGRKETKLKFCTGEVWGCVCISQLLMHFPPWFVWTRFFSFCPPYSFQICGYTIFTNLSTIKSLLFSGQTLCFTLFKSSLPIGLDYNLCHL